MPFDVGGELLSAILGAGVGYVLKFGYDKSNQVFVKDRQIKKTWCFLRETTHLFLPIIDNINKVGAVNGYGDLLALSEIAKVSNRYFSPVDSLVVHTEPGDFEDVKHENLIVLGGGGTNPVFRVLVDLLQIPMHFFDTAEKSFEEIRNKERTVVYSPEYDEKRLLIRDTGLLVRAKNPYSKSKKAKWIIIAAGSYTYGTGAAIQFLTNPETVREVAKYIDKNFEIVVCAKIRNFGISDVELVSKVFTW